MTVDVGIDVEELRAKLDTCVIIMALFRAFAVVMAIFRALAVVDARWHADVFESEDLAVWHRLQDDIGVLLWLTETADVSEHVLFRLGGHARRLTEPPR